MGSALCRTVSAPWQEMVPALQFVLPLSGQMIFALAKEAAHLLEQLFGNWVAGQRQAQKITAGGLHREDND